MRIYIGADHRGFHLKEKIAKWLFDNKYDFEDLGADHLDPDDDYTKHAVEVATLVSDKEKDKDKAKGILLCGSGVGADITANKFDGVRAGVGKSVGQVKAGRRDDDMNILVIAAEYTSEKEVIEMVKAFLETEFDKKARHVKRLQEIERIEDNN